MTRTHAINKAISRSKRSRTTSFYVVRKGENDYSVVPEHSSLNITDDNVEFEVYCGRVERLY